MQIFLHLSVLWSILLYYILYLFIFINISAPCVFVCVIVADYNDTNLLEAALLGGNSFIEDTPAPASQPCWQLHKKDVDGRPWTRNYHKGCFFSSCFQCILVLPAAMCCVCSGVPSVRRWNKWLVFLSWLTIITNCTPPGVMTEQSKALRLGLAGNSSSGMHVCACLSCYLFLRLFYLKFKHIIQIPFSLGLCIRDHSILYYDILTAKSALKHLCSQCSVAEQKLCVLVEAWFQILLLRRSISNDGIDIIQHLSEDIYHSAFKKFANM